MQFSLKFKLLLKLLYGFNELLINMQISIKLKSSRQNIALFVFILFGFLVSGFSLKMPFSSQAPEGNWNEPWYNDCEEVSIAMVDSFYNNRILTPVIAKQEILKIFEIKEKVFGPSLEEDSDQNVNFINNYLNSNWKARIAENPTIEEMKTEIDNGHPIILPVDGRVLDNRYFTTTHYHVFVISGYDDDKGVFVAQEPGTYRGHDYQYSYEIIEEAMHDYNSTDNSLGRRVAIFTSPKAKETESGIRDDNEVKKNDELKVSASPSPSPFVTSSIPDDEDKLQAALEKKADNDSCLETIKNYWARLVEWIKKIF